MYEHAAEYGLVYRSRPPYEVLKTNWLKFGEILRIRQVEEMLEVLQQRTVRHSNPASGDAVCECVCHVCGTGNFL